MPNMKSIIASHNRSLLNKQHNENSTDIRKKCNCRVKHQCPLNGNCLINNIIYQATVTRQDSGEDNTYIGLTENSFKTRYTNHTSTFRHNKYRNSTELSKYIWSLKDASVPYNISWRVVRECPSYSNKTKRCQLCLYEKYMIIFHPESSTLNKRNELASSCRHRRKFLLANT
jgi:hypothetical protein